MSPKPNNSSSIERASTPSRHHRIVPKDCSKEMIAMFKKVFLFFLRIIRRALCCFKRKRCDSNSVIETRLEVVNVIKESPSFRLRPDTMDRDWNSWDDKPRTIEEHIEMYRENLVKIQEPEPVPEVEKINLFEDMTPKIKKQKVYRQAGSVEQTNFSRLEASATAEIPTTNELEDWDEGNQQAGWDEINDQNTKQLIRETRKEIRASKHKSQSVR